MEVGILDLDGGTARWLVVNNIVNCWATGKFVQIAVGNMAAPRPEMDPELKAAVEGYQKLQGGMNAVASGVRFALTFRQRCRVSCGSRSSTQHN